MENIRSLLVEEVKKLPKYKEWHPNIEEFLCVGDENDQASGMRRLPQPGLSDKGVVFSFQPYTVSCYAAGTFHIMIPYEQLKPYLTERAKWCLI